MNWLFNEHNYNIEYTNGQDQDTCPSKIVFWSESKGYEGAQRNHYNHHYIFVGIVNIIFIDKPRFTSAINLCTNFEAI